MKPRLTLCLWMLASLVVGGGACAQDTRSVSEPSPPPSCAVLTAIGPAAIVDEAPRIQAAIDHCAAGHAVRLSAGAERADYHAGPLVLRSGVSLLIDGGVTLYASTNASLYRRCDARCGTVDATGHGSRGLSHRPCRNAHRYGGTGTHWCWRRALRRRRSARIRRCATPTGRRDSRRAPRRPTGARRGRRHSGRWRPVCAVLRQRWLPARWRSAPRTTAAAMVR